MVFCLRLIAQTFRYTLDLHDIYHIKSTLYFNSSLILNYSNYPYIFTAIDQHLFYFFDMFFMLYIAQDAENE